MDEYMQYFNMDVSYFVAQEQVLSSSLNSVHSYYIILPSIDGTSFTDRD